MLLTVGLLDRGIFPAAAGKRPAGNTVRAAQRAHLHDPVRGGRGPRLSAGPLGKAAGAGGAGAGPGHLAAALRAVHRDRGHPHGGCHRAAAQLFHTVAGEDPFRLYVLLVVVSVVLSAFIDNIPYVATMLPVVQGIAALMNNGAGMAPEVFYFGLLIGATLGGN